MHYPMLMNNTPLKSTILHLEFLIVIVCAWAGVKESEIPTGLFLRPAPANSSCPKASVGYSEVCCSLSHWLTTWSPAVMDVWFSRAPPHWHKAPLLPQRERENCQSRFQWVLNYHTYYSFQRKKLKHKERKEIDPLYTVCISFTHGWKVSLFIKMLIAEIELKKSHNVHIITWIDKLH